MRHVELSTNDLNFLRGLLRRKMRDQRNAAWALKRKIEADGGIYEPDLQAESMDYVEDIYRRLHGDPEDIGNLQPRPPATDEHQ
jgi:hypothetical protein